MALRGCWPLKFLHALEIDLALAYTSIGDGVPQKILRANIKNLTVFGVSGKAVRQ